MSRAIIAGAISIVALVATALPSAAQSSAANWPQRPVKFIITLGPGSGADIGARLIAEKLSARWGQPVVIENRPGGDGFVAINAFVSAHDDHVLLYGPASSFTAHPYLHDKLPYDPRDLSPVARATATLIALTVPPTLGVNTLSELMTMAKANPGKLNWATVTGATDLIVAAYFKSTGISMAKIPYRDTVQAQNDVAEGRLQFYWAALAIVRGAIAAGRVKMIAATASEPTKVAPNTPTVAQAGFPQLTFDGLVGLFGPRDMPLELRERIGGDVKAVLADPTIVARLEATGQAVVPGSAAEFAASIDKQRATVAEHAKVLGIKAAQ